MLRAGAVRANIAPNEEALTLEVASRTDRGVHARANALALRSDLSGPALLASLNGIAPDIFALRARPIPPGFRVRWARERWYRYFEGPSEHPLARWRVAAARFRGPVDVRSFGKGVPAELPTVRSVSSVTVRKRPEGLWIDVRAPSFVWGMVRKIVSALRAEVAGTLDGATVRAALRGRTRLGLPLAEPERLVLWEVRYDGRWTHRVPPRPFPPWRHLAREIEAAETRGRVLRALRPPNPRPGPDTATSSGLR